MINKISNVVLGLTLFMSSSVQAESDFNQGWFQTWGRPDYVEWAREVPKGYLLHIMRMEEKLILVVKALLIMGARGLPGFEVLEEFYYADEEQALSKIKLWRQEEHKSSISKEEL